MSTRDFWEDIERGSVVASTAPFFGSTPAERAFKRAFLTCLVDGVYPSARQVYKRVGKRVDGKVNLNGRECRWLREMRDYFDIEPCVSFTARHYRAHWEKWVRRDTPFKLKRASGGALIVNPDYVDAVRAGR